MPRIFDNIENGLLPALRDTLAISRRADFCVGYFNLRGWKAIDALIEAWEGGSDHCCRVLVGMQRIPQDDLRRAFDVSKPFDGLDNQTAIHLKRTLAEEFRKQLMVGAPTNEDEAGLRRLARQLRQKKVVVKLFLAHMLHAKLYLAFRADPISPIVGFLGSSNLTFSGLCQQGELNIDVLDHDACQKLARWFEDRWNDRWCIDISKELLEIIEESWAREEVPPPYHVYVKMAYHLSHEARTGLNEFRLPRQFADMLFEYQAEAVKMAARHLNQRGGVLIGDVVGLGKTLMATALARVFEDDHGTQTLIICPKNLVPMWKRYRERYGLRGRVLSLSRVIDQLQELPGRYRLVLIDESHNLRNREGRRYAAIREYIREMDSKVILLSATPYNKTYLDLGNQLRLFLREDANVGIRPERLIKQIGDETAFLARFQVQPRTLAAFEKSDWADDWRELMRLFLVRRTRSFIQRHYAKIDEVSGRPYLTFPDGTRSYFPERVPKTIRFAIDDKARSDQYARLFADDVVGIINHLRLPRYGLGNYIRETPHEPPNAKESRIIADLSRAGQRLMGFCRTNLFKRLESSGQAFLLSIERHVLRNYIYLHALENGEDVPIGTQDAAVLDSRFNDEDHELFADDDDGAEEDSRVFWTEAAFRERAARVYEIYKLEMHRRFRWLPAGRFQKDLAEDLFSDARDLLGILELSGPWRPEQDRKLEQLLALLERRKPGEKVLIFSQFADTVDYLAEQLRLGGVARVAAATGDSEDPTRLAWRFSPVSNERRDQVAASDELDVLIATDILSEGQNLQDCAVVVNFDLPWAIIRLIQRAGRVDRIGQKAHEIHCYSFLPADGVERIIRLRARVRQRLRENAEVVGTDEAFFEDDQNEDAIRDLFTEKAGVLDDDDAEVDLGSMAYGIWKKAIEADPSLEKTIIDMPDVIYSTKQHEASPERPGGVLAYIRTADDHNALVWLDAQGNTVTESQSDILRAAECAPDDPALPRRDNHHQLVRKAVELVAAEEKDVGGQLGSPRGVRFRTYERLKRFSDEMKGTLFDTQELRRAVEDIYSYPMRKVAMDTLNRQLRAGVNDQDLARLVIELREEDRLSIIHQEDRETRQARIICSLGLAGAGEVQG